LHNSFRAIINGYWFSIGFGGEKVSGWINVLDSMGAFVTNPDFLVEKPD